LPYAVRASARNFSSAASSSLRTLRRRSSRPLCVSASTRGKPGGDTGVSERRETPPAGGALPPLDPCTLKNASLPDVVTHLYKPLLIATGLLLHPDSRAFSARVAPRALPTGSANAHAQHHASARQRDSLSTGPTGPLMHPSVTAASMRQKGRVIDPPLSFRQRDSSEEACALLAISCNTCRIRSDASSSGSA
jgi:hypothetical protein